MIVAVFRQVISKWVVKMKKKKKEKKAVSLLSLNCEHFTFYLYRRQTGNFYQSAIIKLPYCVYQKHVGGKKKIIFLFLQCLILQPQCKHSLALLFGFIELTFSQKYTKQKKRPSLSLSLSSFTLWDVSTPGPVLSIFFSLVQCKSWRPVADGSRLLTHTVKQGE